MPPKPVFTQAQENRIVEIVREVIREEVPKIVKEIVKEIVQIEVKKEVDKLRLEFLKIFELNGFKTK